MMPIFQRKRELYLFLAFMFGLSLSACGGNDGTSASASPAGAAAGEDTENGPAAQPGASPSPSPVVLEYAQAWEEILIEEPGYSKTNLSRGGHYTTDRNACGRATSGSMEIALFQKLNTQMEAALKAPEAQVPFCIDVPNGFRLRGAQDRVVIKIPNQAENKVLFEAKNAYLMCTRIGDQAAGTALFETLNAMVDLAFNEEAEMCGR